MPPFYRILEICLYSVLNFLPFLLLALYPFWERLRFSKAVTMLMIGLLGVFQICMGSLAAFMPGVGKGMLSIISTVLYALFYFAAVDASFGPTLFTLLMLSNIANMVVTISKCMEGVFFGREMARQPYRWTYSVCILAVGLLVAVPLFLYFRKYYVDKVNARISTFAWNYLWLIPSTFYLLWFWYSYGSEKTALEIALEPSSAVFIFCINMGAFLVYHTSVRLVDEQEQNRVLAEKNHQLEIQNIQFGNLNRQIAATRQARHDLRHHVAVMDGYLAAGEYDKLREYLQGYKKSLPGDDAVLYCEHDAVNILLLYFGQQAREKQVGFSVSASIPRQVGIPDSALSVLMGNLLENALEACVEAGDEPPRISVKVKARADAVFVRIENTCDQEVVPDEDGRYRSTKHEGWGVGLESVKNIVAQYEGMLEIESGDGSFCVSALLNVPEGG